MAELNISAQDAMSGVQSITQQGPKLKPTGIFVLDRSLGGGLPERSLVYFSADSRSMSEVFLYQFTQARKTYYFTTSRRPKFIQKDIENLNFDVSNISFVDIYSEYYLTQFGEMVDTIGNEYVDAKIIEFTEYNLKNIMNESINEDINIIIDNFSFYMNLNVNLGMIKRLTNILYETTKEMDCLTYLYGLKKSHPEKVENDILNTADVIFDVALERSADSMTSMLAIPKIRGMVPNSEMIKFKVGDGVQIDTSKDIA